jgi:hypothetical protein
MRTSLLPLFIAACAPTTPYLIDDQQMAEFGTHRFHENQREVYAATLNAASRLGLMVVAQDADAGRIETECVDQNGRGRERAREVGCRSYLFKVTPTADGGCALRAEPHFWYGGREIDSQKWNATANRERGLWAEIFGAVRTAL